MSYSKKSGSMKCSKPSPWPNQRTLCNATRCSRATDQYAGQPLRRTTLLGLNFRMPSKYPPPPKAVPTNLDEFLPGAAVARLPPRLLLSPKRLTLPSGLNSRVLRLVVLCPKNCHRYHLNPSLRVFDKSTVDGVKLLENVFVK